MFVSTSNNSLRISGCCLLLLLVVLVGSSAGQEGKDFCCIRLSLFVPIPMPSEQEYDASGMISAAWYGALRESNILDCPIKYEELSWGGRAELDKLVEAIGEAGGAQPDPQAREAFKKLLDVEYVWKGTLTLNRVDEIQPGYWEEGYLGKKNYVPQEAYGDWTLHMKLVNVHFDEVVKAGSASWTGSASGSGSEAIKNLARSVFSPVDDVIYDYEQIPWKCKVEPEEDEISVGDQMTITIKDIKDSQGRDPKPWQRIVVKVEKGEITNGVKTFEEDSYAFLAGDGQVEVRYKTPDDCKESGTEKIFVYNSCDWGQEWVRPLHMTAKGKEIGNDDFEITCDWEGTIESNFKLSSSGGESLLTAMMPKSEYQATTSWKLDVVFKLDRANERVKIYELKSARFDFSDRMESDAVMQKPGRKLQLKGKDEAVASGRRLSPSECHLELIIDLKKKSYKIEGILYVKNIRSTGDGRLIVDFGPIQHDEEEEEEGTTEYREEILIEEKFKEESPEKLEGIIDEQEELPPDFVEFTEALAGKTSGKIHWKLKRKGKH